MDTRQAKRKLNCAYWQDSIRPRNASGLTVKAFCRTHGISSKRYYYWQHIIRSAALNAAPAAGSATIVPLPAPAAPNEAGPDAVRIQYGPYTLEITAATSAWTLKRVLQPLQEVQPS